MEKAHKERVRQILEEADFTVNEIIYFIKNMRHRLSVEWSECEKPYLIKEYKSVGYSNTDISNLLFADCQEYITDESNMLYSIEDLILNKIINEHK